MSIKEENLIPVEGIIKAGQRLVKIGETFVPIGFGGIFEPGAVIYKEEGRDTYYKCASVGETTWDGYALILGADGYYTVSETLTTGLAYGIGYTPKVDGVYNADATIDVSKYWDGVYVPEGYIFYAPLTSQANSDNTGKNLYYSGNCDFSSGAFSTTGDGYIYTDNCTWFPDGNGAWTISVKVMIPEEHTNSGVLGIYYDSSANKTKGTAVYCYSDKIMFTNHGSGSVELYSNCEVTPNVWHTITFTYDGSTMYHYFDGELVGTHSVSLNSHASNMPLGIGCSYIASYPVGKFDGYIKQVVMYNYAVSLNEVKLLAK